MVMATTTVLEQQPHVFPHASHGQLIGKKSHLLESSVPDGAAVGKQLIAEALHQRVEAIDQEMCDAGDEETFFVADLGEIYRQHLRWKKTLPRVRPFYAVKCHPDPQVIRLLSGLGAGFDCASKGEIEQALSLGATPQDIIYAQPCKTNSYVRYVKSAGVKKMTFDNTDELYKIAKYFPDAELFLRIMTDDSTSVCQLSMKFGAPMETTEGLLALAKELGLNVVGVSFHVGSGASDPMCFYQAVRDASTVFEQARNYGYIMRTLDVGGGFTSETFEHMASALNTALDQFFPAGSNVDIMAEPGRYYVCSAFTIACNVIARRTVEAAASPNGEKAYMLYLNDGVYGNFSGIMFDHSKPVAKVLRNQGQTHYNTPSANQASADAGTLYSVWGPTCDGIDCITEGVRFNQTLDIGDWLYFDNMGAYSKCSATQFNGFTNSHDVIYVCSEPGAKAVLGL